MKWQNDANDWLEMVEAQRSRKDRPLVTLAYAQSIDGSLAARRGLSLALSGAQSTVLTHRLRTAHDAILIGIGTALADDPQLTVRLVPGKSPQPIILDSRLRLPLTGKLMRHPEQKPWLAAGTGADPARRADMEASGARVLQLPTDVEGRVPLDALLDCVAGLGVRRLMVEGGASVLFSFLREGLVDAVVITIAPLFVGGLPAVGNLLQRTAGDFPRLKEVAFEQLENDLILWGRF